MTDSAGTTQYSYGATSSAPAYAYDPYGKPLQGTAPLTDFGYAGMFQEQGSGLNLTQFRAYDPNAGRWLSRDPLGEQSAEGANLYAYVMDNPINFVDPFGLCKRGGPPPDTTDHTKELKDRLADLREQIQKCAGPAAGPQCGPLWDEYLKVVKSPEITAIRKERYDLQKDLLAGALGAEFGGLLGGPMAAAAAAAGSTWDYARDKYYDWLAGF